MGIAVYTSVVAVLIAILMFPRSQLGSPGSLDGWSPGRVRKVAIVTGSNTGVWYETVRQLALGGFEVVLACRSTTKAAAAAATINAEITEAAATATSESRTGRAVPMELDLSDLSSVRQFAEAFKSSGRQLDVFVANAGLNTDSPAQTVDKLNTIFQVNYLGHFLLLQLLLPLLVSTGTETNSSRVVLLSSVMQHVAPGTYTSSAVPLADASYKDSKLAMSVLAEECETRREAAAAATGVRLPVRFMSVNPGAVNSDIWRDDGWVLRMIYSLIFLTTPQGSETSVHVATAVQFASRPEGLQSLYLVPYITYWPIIPIMEAHLPDPYQELHHNL